MANKAAENRHMEQRNLPPQSRYARHDVLISLETWQRPTVGQDEVERLFHLRVTDDGGRIGAEVTCLDLPEAVESQKPHHRAHTESTVAVVDHFHLTHCALPRRAKARQPLRAHEAHVAHDHQEREIEQAHEERELQVEEYDCSKQIRARAPLPDQEWECDLD